MPLLLISRYFYFRSLGWQYFMFDFCYFVISCSMINIMLVRSMVFFKFCFICACGPVSLAIPVWRSSFVFHDYDKIVSVYIHILPCMLYYTLRWYGDNGFHPNSTDCIKYDNSSSPPNGATYVESSIRYCSKDTDLNASDFFLALLGYVTWQTLYLLKTECWDKNKLDLDPSLLTSLRWMSTDTKNATALYVLGVMRSMGVFRPTEDFDPTSMKTKLVFVFSQLVFTVLAFPIAPLLYYSYAAHLMYILLIITISVFNGASFYIEVFSKRYNVRISKIEQLHSIAKQAQIAVDEIATMQITRSYSQDRDMSGYTDNAASVDLVDTSQDSGIISSRSSSPIRDNDNEHRFSDGLTDLSQILEATKNEAWSCMAEQLRFLDDRKIITGYSPAAAVEEEEEGYTDSSESAVRCIDDPRKESDDPHLLSSTEEEEGEEEEPDTPIRSALLDLVGAHHNSNRRDFRDVTYEDSGEDEEEEEEEEGHLSHDTSDNSLSTRDRNDSLLSIDK